MIPGCLFSCQILLSNSDLITHNIFTLCSGFQDIYDVEHFIRTLRSDVQIVKSIQEIHKKGKPKKIKAFQVEHYRFLYKHVQKYLKFFYVLEMLTFLFFTFISL